MEKEKKKFRGYIKELDSYGNLIYKEKNKYDDNGKLKIEGEYINEKRMNVKEKEY